MELSCKLSLCLGLIIICSRIVCQIDPQFESLDLSEINSGIFYPQAPQLVSIPDPFIEDTLNQDQCRQIWFELGSAALSPEIVPSLSDLYQNVRNHQSDLGSIAIPLLCLEFHRFKSNAISDGLVWIEDGVFLDNPYNEESPYEIDCAFIPMISIPNYSQTDLTFEFPSSLFITNTSSEPTQVSVDFDDGLGWRIVEFDEQINILYSEMSVDRTIRLQLETEMGDLICSTILRSGGGATSNIEPHNPPWESEFADSPWKLETPDGNFRGNAYTLYSEDEVFDKPFIFVEGIDFGLGITELKNGTFGWYEFTSGQSYDYPFIADMEYLIEDLRDEGYDIVLVDFEDGADYIQNNAAFLTHAINLINDHKIGKEANVIAGASMGGQVVRYALTKMEEQGQNHCCGIYISLDSPHKGANIPIGLQNAIKYLLDYAGEAEVFRDQYLLRPAARQMLFLQAFSDLNLFDSYYSEINELGFPSMCRNIGLANGSMNGFPQLFEAGDRLLDYSCPELGNGDMLKFEIWSLPGDTDHDLSFNEINVIAKMNIPEVVACEGFWDCLWDLGPNLFLQEPSHYFQNTAGVADYDNAPGGKRSSIQEFIGPLNSSLYSVPDLLCDIITATDYQAHHSFVPTASALAIDTDDMFMDIESALAGDPSISPFDAIYGPSGNEVHSEVNLENISFITSQVFASQKQLPDELTSDSQNSGVFNFGDPKHFILHDLHVHQGGVLHINGDLPIHFGEPNQSPVPGSLMKVKTNPCLAFIKIDEDGIMSIGDPSGGFHGQLEIQSGSTLEITDGGILNLYANSSLIVKDGAELILRGCSVNCDHSSMIIIEQGAKLNIESEVFVNLLRNETEIHLDGEVILGQDAEVEFKGSQYQAGMIVFESGFEGVQSEAGNLITTNGSDEARLKLVFDSDVNVVIPEQVFISDMNHCELRFDGGSSLEANGKIFLDGCELRSTEQDGSVQIKSFNFLKNCYFKDTEITAELEYGTLKVDECLFEGVNSRINVVGAGYSIKDSEFLSSGGIKSTDLVSTSLIDQCSFTNPDGVMGLTAVFDNSYADIIVENSSIEELNSGIEKYSGSLILGCNSIVDCYDHGILIANGGELMASTGGGAGNNSLINNDVNILLVEAGSIDLDEGYNIIRDAEDHLIYGTMIGECNSCLDQVILARHNTWNNVDPDIVNGIPLTGLDPDLIEIFIEDSDCLIDNWSSGCSAVIYDPFPVYPSYCSPYWEDGSGSQKSVEETNQSDHVHSGLELRFIENNKYQIQSLADHGMTFFRVLNVLGDEVLIGSENLDKGGAIDLHLNSLAPGVYLVYCNNQLCSESWRIVVK